MKRNVYADNCATTALDPAAFEAMTPFLLGNYANASQPYALARAPKKALADARETIADAIGAAPDEIYFTSGGTESDNWAIKGVVGRQAGEGSRRRGVLASAIEHHAVLRAVESVRRLGAPVAYLAPDGRGVVRSEELARLISDEVALVSVMLVNNELGAIQPIAALAELARSRGALFHTDAVQGVGHVPIDVKALGVDLLSASAHKFNGPKGVGFLYVRRGVELAPFLDGGGQERGLRAGTENVAGVVGMATALQANVAALASTQAALAGVETRFLSTLNALGVVYALNTGEATRAPGVLSLAFPGFEGEALLHRLDLLGVSVSTGSACNSQETEISHVLKAIGAPDSLARGTIRISFGKQNTEEDALYVAECLAKITRTR